ncbi:glycosyltransferase family 4 protein [Dolichospermum sp. LEGE 00240]|uniref:glycosyltransferase family 4 protein n=1 Tax=Dolichospermum sp. LEGE 00240 TaxID=1828603 RepID=UPI00187EA52E|nr:glycosyltransferase family 4 protein [Dolichospermum sp. LEGE 00240]MDM3843717.1 glycosyltransferase family 4 protein [Aphanizomenon gracile PMC638.10]MDM3849563.1 glycosyltransferase family 4 protein [Aphanizomenon gracile PMC627.10]MDM3856002.1 glycosyltransferase family 4 protein [Aphanizomenon gracile PMC649.10]MDM3861330.1 glycosyltransferase family 4 protein [Aphanizomenon gracile PMC644.10]MBE9248712.1 glycosyltransferase family 4 protein [Dolichospermum sp. LEGE 00240]
MKILFLDQSGKPGGAELCLVDIAKPYGKNALVGLFADGDFRKLLAENQVPVEVLTTQAIKVGKQSGLFQALGSLGQIIPLIHQVVQRARKYDLIYANTQKALVVGAIASFLARRPLVYHLHDILSLEHFSKTNLQVAVNLINRCAALVIANSQASKMAFLEAGGKSDLVRVVYNGFAAKNYEVDELEVRNLRENLKLEDKFVIGHFSRLSPWKGQHILIDALSQCPQDVVVILVGDALFGEQEYVKDLHQKVTALGLENRVNFLGFRADIPQLMTMCDLVTHTSTAPEPFGRVIVEAMLCGKPVIAAEAGGAMELVEDGINGFLVAPGEPQELAQVIHNCRQESAKTANIANNARISASERFDVRIINQQIQELLKSIRSPTS